MFTLRWLLWISFVLSRLFPSAFLFCSFSLSCECSFDCIACFDLSFANTGNQTGDEEGYRSLCSSETLPDASHSALLVYSQFSPISSISSFMSWLSVARGLRSCIPIDADMYERFEMSLDGRNCPLVELARNAGFGKQRDDNG